MQGAQSRVMVQCVHQCAVQAHGVVRTGLAYEARKAPGGAYMHNIFHQSEHLLCMLNMVRCFIIALAILLTTTARVQ